MKKIMILAAGFAVLASPAIAQISFAPEVGLNLANMHTKYKDLSGAEQKMDDGIKLGVKLGANVNIPVCNNVTIQPGLFYSIKGVKIEEDASYGTYTGTEKNNVTLHYIDIPVNIQYMFNDPDEGRFFIGVGPYLGIAISGKSIQNGTYSGTGAPAGFDTSYSLKFGNDYPSNDLRRFDFGGQVNVGYLLQSGIFFRGMYQQSITNLVPQGNQDAFTQAMNPRSRPTNITISVGYVLGGRPDAKKHKEKAGAM
jgi:hypothetical protein